MTDYLFKRCADAPRKIVGWGVDKTFTVYHNHYPVQLDYLVDNDEKKWGMEIEGLSVYSPEKFRQENVDNITVIIYTRNFSAIQAIEKQLGYYGIFAHITVRSLFFYAHRDEVSTCFWDLKKTYKGKDLNHWRSHPHINRLLNHRLTGNADINWLTHIIGRYFSNRSLKNVLVLGCGTGSLERKLTRQKKCHHIDAIDISAESIYEAKQKAEKLGLNNIHYTIGNLNDIIFTQEYKYDLILAEECMHHIYNLEYVYEQINKVLAPGGMFVQSEYVGPNHFQLANEQVVDINMCLDQLDPSYKRYNRFDRIPLHCMLENDPCEAIRSEDILQLTGKFFTIVDRMNLGGNIVPWIFYCLNAEYFYDDSPETSNLIELWMEFEEVKYLSNKKTSESIIISAVKQK